MEKPQRSYNDLEPRIKPNTLITYELNSLRQEVEVLREDHEELKGDYHSWKSTFVKWKERGFGMMAAIAVGIAYWAFGVSSTITLIKWLMANGMN